MKKILAAILVLTLVLCSAAFAEDMGVQVIGGPDLATDTVSLDDIKLETEITIDGYGLLMPKNFVYQDSLGYYRAGKHDPCSDNDYNYSGADAEYALLFMDITNLATKSHDFLADCSVTVFYDDVYEYGGWLRQQNYNNVTYTYYANSADKGKQNVNWVINSADQFSIDPMYSGHYVFGCTLPNAVVNGKAPLRMVITMDGNEITYNIRK